MKHLTALLLSLMLILALGGCDDKSTNSYISASGSGTLAVGSYSPIALYKFVAEIDDADFTLLLLGGLASVADSTAYLTGTGPAVYVVYPNSESADSLSSTTFTIDGGDYTVAYSSQMNFNNTFFLPDASSMTTMTSGTLALTVSGSWYTVKILGVDSNGDTVTITYYGYLYALYNDL